MPRKLKVNATIVYEIRGVKAYKGIAYQVNHWEDAITELRKTKEWEYTNNCLYHNRLDSRIIGITFNFSNEETI